MSVEGHEGSQMGEEKEVESKEQMVEKQEVEDNAGSEEESKEEEEGRIDEAEKINEGLEGRLGEVSEVNADGKENPESNKDDGKEEKGDDGEKESVPFDEEEVEKLAEKEEIETEIVLLDDVETDNQEAPRDERSTRRQFRQSKKHKDEALASRAKRLRLEDIEETEEAIPQVQETLATEKDISPEAPEMRYEAERKRKGKHAAKPQKKKPRQASATVVIREATPETVRVPFSHPTEEERDEEPGNPQTEEGVYEKMEVLVTKRLLDAMVQFEDPKLQQACDGRAANGKLAKSEKSLCLSDLRDLGVEKKSGF